MFKKILLKSHFIYRQAVSSLLIGLSLILASCVYDPIYYGPPPYTHYHPDYYDYYFYPYAGVYFQFTTGYYFYWLDGRWVKTRELPPKIHLDINTRVKIKVQDDIPYSKYDEHIRIYKKPRPDVQVDIEKSRKERDANERWYQEYEKSRDKREKKLLKDEMRPGMR